MGLFWDLVQQSQIQDQKDRSSNLEQRIADLEYELDITKRLLIKTLKTLETVVGRDIDGDGKLG